ncbi:MAG TPA: type IV pilus twitching motility protein PilT [Aquifex aeolicus]|uniref:Type IV pilus twitching motility protein PilT n=1 Tax=Aquifex aeolicus TaxID=63363 RepID=A0A9D0YNR7_AQUAO|nr:type IV pilus twitching motility protein PilT [Aquifex aeolicus]
MGELLTKIVKEALDHRASDIHLKVGAKPRIRTHKELITLDTFPVLSRNNLEEFVNFILKGKEEKRQKLLKEGQVDTSASFPGLARFRANIYYQRSTLGIALRYIPFEIPKFEKLNLPSIVRKMALSHTSGLILVTGPTGSGKSTTLASLINEINEIYSRVIVTIEDPIEYLFKDKKSFIIQREVGEDTVDFYHALRAALREDPDVIMIGEIRDAETAKIALQAAETGHLVFSTMHTINAKETINRFIGMFPLENREQIRLMLAHSLIGIISQRLLPRKDKKGVIPAVEILVNNPLIKESLLDPDKFQNITEYLEKGHEIYGTQTFDQHLLQLYQKGLIDAKTVLEYAENPTDIELKIRGLTE